MDDIQQFRNALHLVDDDIPLAGSLDQMPKPLRACADLSIRLGLKLEGAALEGLVAQHLRACLAYSPGDTRLFFWRTRSGVEVDFILYGDLGFLAIEVQNSATVRSSDLRPLRSFVADYPEAQALLLYRGREELLIDGIRCLPVEAFLRSLAPSKGTLAGVRALTDGAQPATSRIGAHGE